MGVSPVVAYILIIVLGIFGGGVLGAVLSPGSPGLMKICAILGLVFSVALVIAEVFPWIL